jgi:predicted dehydrogenase
MDTVRLAAVGLGGLGWEEATVYNEFEDVDVVAGADVSDHAREGFEEVFDAPAYADYETMLDHHGDELDAVSIVTPHELHYDQASDCFDGDLDVFLEKPMVTSIEDAVDLIQRADEEDHVLSVGYQRHFEQAYQSIRQKIDDGVIGDVHGVHCYLGQDWIENFKDAWRTQPELSGGGELSDSGSHLLDAMLWTTDTTPRTVSAEMDAMGYDVDVNSAISATLSRDGQDRDVTASIFVTGDGLQYGPEEGIFIYGTEGAIEYTGDHLLVRKKDGLDEEVLLDGDEPYPNPAKLRDFVDAVKGEKEPAVPGEYGLNVTALTEAAYMSAESGERVDIRDEILRYVD